MEATGEAVKIRTHARLGASALWHDSRHARQTSWLPLAPHGLHIVMVCAILDPSPSNRDDGH